LIMPLCRPFPLSVGRSVKIDEIISGETSTTSDQQPLWLYWIVKYLLCEKADGSN
jgi:hypothetical protein